MYEYRSEIENHLFEKVVVHPGKIRAALKINS
jgi:hypothetical protein